MPLVYIVARACREKDTQARATFEEIVDRPHFGENKKLAEKWYAELRAAYLKAAAAKGIRDCYIIIESQDIIA